MSLDRFLSPSAWNYHPESTWPLIKYFKTVVIVHCPVQYSISKHPSTYGTIRIFIRELYCTYIQADRHIHAVRRFIRDLYCTYMIQADWHIHAVWRFIREPQDTCTILSVLVCILSSTSPTLFICCTVYRLHCISAALYSKSMLHCKSAALNNTSTCINPLLGSYKCLFAAL